MDWFETLPNNCPPQDAESPEGKIFYRVGKNSPPKNEDFFSHRKLYPEKKFNTSECKASSLSVFNSPKECEKIAKLPTFKDISVVIIKLALKKEDGVVKQTGMNNSHYSWWRSSSFNISDGIII